MTKHSPELRKSVAHMYLHTNASLKKVAEMHGVSTTYVSQWARKSDPDTYEIARGRTRQLLQAQEVLDAVPHMRQSELALIVGVSHTTIQYWCKKGFIELDVRCSICGEPVSSKGGAYCTSCTEKDWPRLASAYGMDYEQLKSMPTACEVCGSTDTLHVDHDHTTGKYRGILCMSCNVALGHMKEDTGLLNSMIKYINKNNK